LFERRIKGYQNIDFSFLVIFLNHHFPLGAKNPQNKFVTNSVFDLSPQSVFPEAWSGPRGLNKGSTFSEGDSKIIKATPNKAGGQIRLF